MTNKVVSKRLTVAYHPQAEELRYFLLKYPLRKRTNELNKNTKNGTKTTCS